MGTIHNISTGAQLDEAEVLESRVVNPGVVEALETALEMARSGEMRGVALVYAYPDGATGVMRRGAQTYSMVGRIDAMKLAILNDLGT